MNKNLKDQNLVIDFPKNGKVVKNGKTVGYWADVQLAQEKSFNIRGMRKQGKLYHNPHLVSGMVHSNNGKSFMNHLAFYKADEVAKILKTATKHGDIVYNMNGKFACHPDVRERAVGGYSQYAEKDIDSFSEPEKKEWFKGTRIGVKADLAKSGTGELKVKPDTVRACDSIVDLDNQDNYTKIAQDINNGTYKPNFPNDQSRRNVNKCYAGVITYFGGMCNTAKNFGYKLEMTVHDKLNHCTIKPADYDGEFTVDQGRYADYKPERRQDANQYSFDLSFKNRDGDTVTSFKDLNPAETVKQLQNIVRDNPSVFLGQDSYNCDIETDGLCVVDAYNENEFMKQPYKVVDKSISQAELDKKLENTKDFETEKQDDLEK